MRPSAKLLIPALFLASTVSQAKGLSGTVKLADGVTVESSDLFVVWTDTCAEHPKPGADLEIREKDFQYAPHALVGQLGQKLQVVNADQNKHNSFALKNVSFDSGLQKPGTRYEVKLDKAGVTKLFCRIHPKMGAEVLVLTNPCFRKLEGRDALSRFDLPEPPKAGGKVWLWSPRLKAFKSVPAAAHVELSLAKDDFLAVKEAPPPSDGGGYQ